MIKFLVCLLPLVAFPASAGIEPPPYDAFAYDVKGDKGPCPITQKELDTVTVNFGDCMKRKFVFRDSNGLYILILHPRFRAEYSAPVTSQIDRGSGLPDVRGLNDISPIALSALGTPIPAPAAHGGRLPSTIVITPVTAAQVLAQLVDSNQMNQLELTLRSQATDLSDAYFALSQDAEEFRSQLNRVIGPESGACDALAGAPGIRPLLDCVTRLGEHIDASDRATQYRGPEPIGCNAAMPAYAWDAAEFDCVVMQIDQRIADLGIVRSRLNEYGFRAVADRIETESEQLVAKLNLFRANLATIRTTVVDFQALQRSASGLHLNTNPGGRQPATPEMISRLRRAEIKKQLKEKYGAVLDEAELNHLATIQERAFDNDVFQQQFERAISRLLDDIARYEADLRGGAGGNAALVPNTQAARAIGSRVRDDAVGLGARVDGLNRAFAQVFTSINNVYFTKSAKPLKRPIDLSTGSGTNRDVFCALKSEEHFTPFRFTLVPAAAPAAAQSAAANPLIAAAANPNLTVTPANLPQNLNKSFDFQMHKFWRANIVGGFVFSSIASKDFAGVTKQSTANGQTTTTIVAGKTNDQQPTAHYLLGFNYYFRPRDTYPKYKPSNGERWMPGLLGGVGLESTKHFFIGPNFEPTLGFDISIGYHYGEQKALPLDVKVGDALSSSSITTRSVMKHGIYGMIGFDLNIFRRFLGAAAR